MMYDSFHSHIEEKDQATAIASCAAETIHVHVSENDRGIPGTGQVDWDGYWAGLKASGFNGYATIEAFGRALPALAAATKVCATGPRPHGPLRAGARLLPQEHELTHSHRIEKMPLIGKTPKITEEVESKKERSNTNRSSCT